MAASVGAPADLEAGNVLAAVAGPASVALAAESPPSSAGTMQPAALTALRASADPPTEEETSLAALLPPLSAGERQATGAGGPAPVAVAATAAAPAAIAPALPAARDLPAAPPAPRAAPKPARGRGRAKRTEARKRYRGAFELLVFAPLIAVNLVGLPYYMLDVAQRVRSPLHPWFKPSGYIGQSAGIVAFLMFAWLWMYPLRKKYPWLGSTGTIRQWLDAHVVFGLAAPLLAAVHAAWQFDGLIGLGYAGMVIVALSGVVGRYLYLHVPRGRNGLELSLEEIAETRSRLLRGIAHDTGIPLESLECLMVTENRPPSRGLAGAFARMVSDDVQRWKAARALRRGIHELLPEGRALPRRRLRTILRNARRQIALTQQIRVLDATQRVFSFWHVAHRPIALTVAFAVLVHIGVVVSLGVTWFW